MSKIVQAINTMISNPKLIKNIIQSGKEYFFLYNEKYKWSIKPGLTDDDYFLYFYPGNESIDDLAQYEPNEWDGTNMITYQSSEIGTKEAHASFAELYREIKENVFNINNILDDIISSNGSK